MDGSRGPQLFFSHSKGATLPGYRAASFRTTTHSPHPSTIARRSSDGDLSDSKLVRDKCRKYESRFWTSYRSESPSGESGTIISDPKEPSASWESPDLVPQISSRPTITPLASPASPRPHVRRSFNTFPRPWKARSRSPSPFRMKEQLSKSPSDNFHFRSFNDSLKQMKPGMVGKREDGEPFETDKCRVGQNGENSITKPQEISIVRPVPFYTKPTATENVNEAPPNLYRSVATITVTRSPNSPNFPSQPSVDSFTFASNHIREENPAKKLTSILSALTNRKTLGSREAKPEAHQQVAEEGRRENLIKSPPSRCIYDAREKEKEQQQQPTPPSASSYLPHATKFSISTSLVPCVHDEHGSAPLPCDEENRALHRFSDQSLGQSDSSKKEVDDAQLVYDLQTNKIVDTERDSRFENTGASSGGSGPGDREAPLTESNAQGLMQASGRKSVRKKPQIPDQLSRRRCSEDGDQRSDVRSVAGSFLGPSQSFSSGVHSYRIKKTTQPCISQTVKSQSVSPTRPVEEKQEFSKNRTTVSQILSTLNFARFRLEELTGALGGNKKEGGKGSSASVGRVPPPRPPRTRHDLDKLRKSTERLKNSDHKTSSEVESDLSNKDNLPPKTSIRGTSETASKHVFFPKQAIVRTNSSPAGVSRSSSLLSSLSSKLLNNESKNSDNLSNTSSNSLLPPLPLPKQKASSQTKDNSFRSAFVSQGNLSNEEGCIIEFPNLKILAACKEPWGYHTLPRCSPVTQNPSSALLYLAEGQEQTPLTGSLHGIDKLDSECGKKEEISSLKSKSEIELRHAHDEEALFSFSLSNLAYITDDPNDEVERESKFEEIKKDSFIEKLLQNDCYGAENIPFSKDEEENSEKNDKAALKGCVHPTNTSLKSSSNNEKNFGHDVNKLNQSDDNISEATFEKELLEKSLSLENVRPYKDICVQTEETSPKENEKNKRRNFKGVKAKSFEDKREKLRLRIDNRSFDLKQPPDIKSCQKMNTESLTLPTCDSDNDGNLKQQFRSDSSGIECRVVKTEPRQSQCIVIRSGSFNKSKDGEGGQGEPGATSECRVVQTRQRLSLEDSEGESTDRDRKSLSIRSEGSEGRGPMDGVFSGILIESSDSSSQDSVGVLSNKNKKNIHPQPALTESNQYDDGTEKKDCRRRKSYPDEILELDLSLSNNQSKKQENLKKFNWHYDQRKSLKTDLSLSDGDSRPNSYSEPESLQLILAASSRSVEKRGHKKRNRSDPGLINKPNQDSVDYFSDSNLETFKERKVKYKNVEKRNHVSRSAASANRVVSQASTDSEGKDDLASFKGGFQDGFRHFRVQTSKFFNPPVILSGQESDASLQDISGLGEYALNRISRNASPCPYLGDSDSGEKCFPRSPNAPRRYPKRPLRGPYGEMLEAEMSKSKSSSQFLNDDLFLRPRESQSTSPRPSSPASPSAASGKNQDPFGTSPVIFVGGENIHSRSSPHSASGSRSLDDSALKLYCSGALVKPEGSHLKPLGTAPCASYESDGETGLTALPPGPLHQRTASSPSKLFFEPAKSEDRDLLGIFAPSKRQSKSRPRAPPEQEKPKITQSPSNESSPKTKVKPPKSKPDRHSKSPKGKKHAEEEPHPHASQQQPLKKGSHETEFRTHSEHRHAHRRHRVSTLFYLH